LKGKRWDDGWSGEYRGLSDDDEELIRQLEKAGEIRYMRDPPSRALPTGAAAVAVCPSAAQRSFPDRAARIGSTIMACTSGRLRPAALASATPLALLEHFDDVGKVAVARPGAAGAERERDLASHD
jgi:hypothetical protein